MWHANSFHFLASVTDNAVKAASVTQKSCTESICHIRKKSNETIKQHNKCGLQPPQMV